MDGDCQVARSDGGCAFQIQIPCSDNHITLIAGDGLCNEDVVKMVVSKAPERLKELINWGTDFDKCADGNYDLGKEGGHSTFRILHHKDVTGYEIQRKLMLKVNDKTKYEKGCWYDVNTYLFFREYFTNDLNNSIGWTNEHTKEPWGRNHVATSGDSWACTQEKYIGYSFVNYTTSTKKIDVCTCVDSPCSNSSNILNYSTQWD